MVQRYLVAFALASTQPPFSVCFASEACSLHNRGGGGGGGGTIFLAIENAEEST